MGYYNQLAQFLNQAKTENLKTKHFDSEYNGTEVKVSFGQGNQALIPWISFLKKPNTTSKGIYPGYLYYKDYEILILAYCISETNTPNSTWNLENEITIKDYFKSEFSKDPYRYGNSYIFKVYNAKNLPGKEIIERDLDEILKKYLDTEQKHRPSQTNQPNMQLEIDEFQNSLIRSGLIYSNKLINRFTASLLTKPFVILTGLSGSGKTKLAQAFVQWICQDESQFCIVPVGADWTNREPLLGYPNALKPEEYVKPDNGVLNLILQANRKPFLPHFLILDEMNLSHVERYFADFLSVMESGEEIPLHAEKAMEGEVPSQLTVPANLFIIGTVNIDETTNMFSPKVLDRANTIEFRVTDDEMQNFLANIREINMEELNTEGAGMAKSFLELAANKSFVAEDKKEINETLLKFFRELKRTGAEFGYRSASEILRLIENLSIVDKRFTTHEKLDIAIMQKLLPKLHGSRRKLTPVLETLASFCIEGGVRVINDIFEKNDYDFNDPKVLYPLSLEKITRMYKGAVDNGFASFAEA